MLQKNVLIVDDNEFIRASIVKYLENHRLNVQGTKSADEAINYLRQNHCDLVITDILMPGKDGFELVDTIRQSDETFSNIPIIAISGGGKTVDAESALSVLEEKVDFLLKKPFGKSTLLETISTIFESPRASTAEVQNAT